MKNFTEFIKESRELTDMTQREFADFIHVSLFTVRAWEQNKRPEGIPMEGLIRDYIKIKLELQEY